MTYIVLTPEVVKAIKDHVSDANARSLKDDADPNVFAKVTVDMLIRIGEELKDKRRAASRAKWRKEHKARMKARADVKRPEIYSPNGLFYNISKD